jgi:hypothetical protein
MKRDGAEDLSCVSLRDDPTAEAHRAQEDERAGIADPAVGDGLASEGVTGLTAIDGFDPLRPRRTFRDVVLDGVPTNGALHRLRKFALDPSGDESLSIASSSCATSAEK